MKLLIVTSLILSANLTYAHDFANEQQFIDSYARRRYHSEIAQYESEFRRATARVAELEVSARNWSLDSPVPRSVYDELDKLRRDKSVAMEGIRRWTAQAAHELRDAEIRNEHERYLKSPIPEGRGQDILSSFEMTNINDDSKNPKFISRWEWGNGAFKSEITLDPKEKERLVKAIGPDSFYRFTHKNNFEKMRAISFGGTLPIFEVYLADVRQINGLASSLRGANNRAEAIRLLKEIERISKPYVEHLERYRKLQCKSIFSSGF